MFRLALAIVFAIAIPGQSGTDFQELRRLFDYDRSAPIDLKIATVPSPDTGTRILDISYASPKGGRVDGYIVEPSAAGTHRPGVVFGHWGPGNRSEFLPEAIAYARRGAVTILINYPWTRPLESRREFHFEDARADVEVARQAVIDLRRAFDVLLARGDVDANRLAYVGHSYGAQWGAILAAVDQRMKVAILIGGVGASADMWERSYDPDMVKLRREWPPEKRTPYIREYSQLDAVRYAPHAAPVALYFQFARFERLFDEVSMNTYFAAASAPKHITWYSTGHELNDPQALLDRSGWLEKEIELPSTRLTTR